VQVVVMNITEAQADYVTEVVKTLRSRGLRVECDLRNEKINYKIREHSLQKLPYQVVVGDKEKAAKWWPCAPGVITDLGQMTLDTISSVGNDEIADGADRTA
jgi:threonyl-tRNA synthetase